MNESVRIALIGGSGALGGGLARRLARAGHQVTIGSRDSGRAAATAAAISTATGATVHGAANTEAAARGEIVIVTVPWSSHADTFRQIAPAAAGSIVVDTTVPLVPPKIGTVQLPPQGCAALAAFELLGPQTRLVSAFHNVSAAKLAGENDVDCDVLVFGDDKDAREAVVNLAESIGLHGLHGGPLANSVAAEALTSVLITINRRYRVPGAGIRITGLATP